MKIHEYENAFRHFHQKKALSEKVNSKVNASLGGT